MTAKNGWASIRAVEITIEPGDDLDISKAIGAALTSLGWGPGEREFNLSTTVNLNGPTDPPPVEAKERSARPYVAKVELPHE